MKDDIVKSPPSDVEPAKVSPKTPLENGPKKLLGNENYDEKIDPVMTKAVNTEGKTAVAKKPEPITQEKTDKTKSEQAKPTKPKSQNSGATVVISIAVLIFIVLAGLAVYNQMQ